MNKQSLLEKLTLKKGTRVKIEEDLIKTHNARRFKAGIIVGYRLKLMKEDGIEGYYIDLDGQRPQSKTPYCIWHLKPLEVMGG